MINCDGEERAAERGRRSSAGQITAHQRCLISRKKNAEILLQRTKNKAKSCSCAKDCLRQAFHESYHDAQP